MTLRQLLRDAELGTISGVVAAVHYGGSEFLYMGTGTLCRNVVLGIGALAILREKLNTPACS